MAVVSPDEVIRDVGRRIAELREARGWSQQAFAEEADVSVKWIQAVERGHNLTIRTAAKLSGILGVAIGELFEAPKSTEPRRPGRPRASGRRVRKRK